MRHIYTEVQTQVGEMDTQIGRQTHAYTGLRRHKKLTENRQNSQNSHADTTGCEEWRGNRTRHTKNLTRNRLVKDSQEKLIQNNEHTQKNHTTETALAITKGDTLDGRTDGRTKTFAQHRTRQSRPYYKSTSCPFRGDSFPRGQFLQHYSARLRSL